MRCWSNKIDQILVVTINGPPARNAVSAAVSAVGLNDYLVEEAWGVPILWVTYPWVMSDKVGNFSAEMGYATTWGPYDFRYLTVSE